MGVLNVLIPSFLHMGNCKPESKLISSSKIFSLFQNFCAKVLRVNQRVTDRETINL